jgi:hypothetical protein
MMIRDSDVPTDSSGVPAYVEAWKYLLGICTTASSSAYSNRGTEFVSFYPNPFHSEIAVTFSIPVKKGALILFNSAGQIVRKITDLSIQENEKIILSRSNLSPGVYFFMILDGGGKIIASRIILAVD